MLTRILVDANVLYSRTLRDWLLQLQLAQGALFATCWTVDIHAEVLSRLRKQNPEMDGGALTTVSDRIMACMTERISKYPHVPQTFLSDEYDAHLHSAAIAGGVDMLMTQDRDFLDLGTDVTDNLPYEICSADDTFVLIDDSAPELVRIVTRSTWDYWRRREPSADVPAFLTKAGCPEFAKRVRDHIHRQS